MKKITIFLVICFLLNSLVSAQLDDVGQDLQNQIEVVEEKVDTARDFTEEDRYNFLTEQWKEFLLKNKTISGVNGFFEKIDLFFVIVFGMHWSLSLQMFFAFLIWVSTLLVLFSWFSFASDKWLRLLYAFLGNTILLAQINFFEYLGDGAFKLVFYKDTIIWKLLFFVVVIFLIVLWYKINNLIAKFLEGRRKKKKENEAKLSMEEIEKTAKTIREA